MQRPYPTPANAFLNAGPGRGRAGLVSAARLPAPTNGRHRSRDGASRKIDMQPVREMVGRVETMISSKLAVVQGFLDRVHRVVADRDRAFGVRPRPRR